MVIYNGAKINKESPKKSPILKLVKVANCIRAKSYMGAILGYVSSGK